MYLAISKRKFPNTKMVVEIIPDKV